MNQKLYVPMLAKVFDMQESDLYDAMTNESCERFLQSPEQINLRRKRRYYVYHTNPDQFVQHKEVMMRLLCPFELNVNFETKAVSQPA